MSRELHALERDIEDRASEAVKRRAVDNQESSTDHEIDDTEIKVLYGKYQEAKVAGWRNVANALLTEKYPEPGAATANLSGRRSDITPLEGLLIGVQQGSN